MEKAEILKMALETIDSKDERLAAQEKEIKGLRKALELIQSVSMDSVVIRIAIKAMKR